MTLSGTVATVSGNSVTLTLATALTSATQTVTVSYADPTTGDDSNGVQDLADNDADSFTDQTVTNRFGSAPTVTGVALTSVSVNNNTWAIGERSRAATVTFSEAVDITGAPQLELAFAGAPKAADCDADTNTTTMLCSLHGGRKRLGPERHRDRGEQAHAQRRHHHGHRQHDHQRQPRPRRGGDRRRSEGRRHPPDTRHHGRQCADDVGRRHEGDPDVQRDHQRRPIDTKITIMSGTASPLSTSAASATGTKVEIDLTTALTTTSTTHHRGARRSPQSEDGAGNGNLAVAATTVINAVGSATTPTVTGVALTSEPQQRHLRLQHRRS